ncbi:MAG TPA: Fic family protein [Anaeromyxobacteraceae bacterium]|nr:Fic family protein [Anaeromyxobacteraceae bacterium]
MRSRYVDIDDRSEDLQDRMRSEPEIAADFLSKYELSWLYHENALEGVVYTNQELELALAHQPLAEASFVQTLQEIQNHKVAMDFIRDEAKSKKLKLSIATAKKLYELLGANIEGRSVAEYRKDMPLHRAYFHDIAQPARIEAGLKHLFDVFESADFKTFHPIQQAAKLHHGFMAVYPYTENSGRVGRLLANLVLLNEGYLPCIVHATDRQRYYESLKGTDSALRDLMIDSYDNALAQAEKFFDFAVAQRRKAAR